MSSLFKIRENTHHTRYFQVLSNESRRAVNYCVIIIFKPIFEKFAFTEFLIIANEIARSPQGSLKRGSTVNIFKRKRKNWKGENCPCRLCKTYVRELGYI